MTRTCYIPAACLSSWSRRQRQSAQSPPMQLFILPYGSVDTQTHEADRESKLAVTRMSLAARCPRALRDTCWNGTQKDKKRQGSLTGDHPLGKHATDCVSTFYVPSASPPHPCSYLTSLWNRLHIICISSPSLLLSNLPLKPVLSLVNKRLLSCNTRLLFYTQ